MEHGRGGAEPRDAPAGGVAELDGGVDVEGIYAEHEAVARRQAETRRRIWRGFLRLVLILAVLGPIAWVGAKRMIKEDADHFTLNWLRACTLAQGCTMYATDHAGRFPDLLKDAVPQYIKNPEALKHESRGKPEFIYFDVPGVKSPPDLPLIAAPVKDRGGRIVVRVSQNAELMNERAYKKLVKRYEAWVKEEAESVEDGAGAR